MKITLVCAFHFEKIYKAYEDSKRKEKRNQCSRSYILLDPENTSYNYGSGQIRILFRRFYNH
jgi:hypothetical protein